MKSTWMLDCITTCYDSKDYAPEKCLVCLLEKAPMCVAPCGFTNLASIGAWPAPSHGGVTDCIQQGQGILMKDGSKMEDTNIVDQMIPGVHSAYECGMKCLDSARFTYYNEWAARSEDRYNCYCLNAWIVPVSHTTTSGLQDQKTATIATASMPIRIWLKSCPDLIWIQDLKIALLPLLPPWLQ